MEINTNLLKNDFILKVKKGKNNLEDAYDILAEATVPSDFSSTYRQKLKNTKTSIGNLEDDLNDLKTYASEKVDSFESAESKNEKLLKSLVLEALATVSVVNTTTEATENTIENGVEQIADWVEDAWNSASAYITQKADDLENWAYETALQVSDWWTGAKETASEWWSDVKDWASETYEWATGALETVGNCIFDMVSFVCTGVCALVADVVNVAFAIIKGLANVVEGIVDALAIVGAIQTTGITFACDIVNGIVTGDWDFEATTTMWKGVMSFVANDYVGMAYDWFYEDTAVGAWLNETAHSPFKTDGVVTGIAEGIGEMIGVIALAIVTGGGSAIAMAGVAGVSAAGRAVESNWNEARENAEEGEDWRTLSTWASGITEGLLTGAWEGISWYIGSEIFMTKFGTRAGRMVWDTVTGALDVPARTLITFISTGGETSLAEAFAEQGGWQGILTCAAVALIGSGVGEYFDYRKTTKSITTAPTDVNWNNLSNTERNEILQNAIDGKYSTKLEISVSNLNDLTQDEITKIINNCDTISILNCDINTLIAFAYRNNTVNWSSLSDTGKNAILQFAIDGNYGTKIEISVSNLNDLTSDEITTILSNWNKISLQGSNGRDNVFYNLVDFAYNNIWKSNSIDTQIKITDISTIAKNELSTYGITEEQINSALDQVRIISDDQWKDVCKAFGCSNRTAGFNTNGTGTHIIYIPESATEVTIYHEMLHSLGDVKASTTTSRGINEAMTETIAELAVIGNTDSVSKICGYAVNVNFLTDILDLVDDGYDTMMKSYFGNDTDSSILKNILNGIMGDNSFYDELTKNMDIADGFSEQTEDTVIEEARKAIDKLIFELKTKIGGK